MRILIIGPLGSQKSSFAYTINKKHELPRLNLDRVHHIKSSRYHNEDEQFMILNEFLKS